MSHSAPGPRVAAITPTRDRHDFLPKLVATFRSQLYPHKRLIVVDDSATPSTFMAALSDPEILYLHLAEPISTGAKRNLLVNVADADIIAHFDDDDFYHPSYLVHMLEHLRDAAAVTLSSWFSYSPIYRVCIFWDTMRPVVGGTSLWAHAAPGPITVDVHDSFTFGYGFSYVYRNPSAARVVFDDVDFGEDYAFMSKLRAERAVVAVPDEAGRVLHVIHGSNLSSVFGQYNVPLFVLERLMGEGVRAYL